MGNAASGVARFGRLLPSAAGPGLTISLLSAAVVIRMDAHAPVMAE